MEKSVVTNEELQAIRDAAIPKGVGIQTTVYADKARNAEIWDVEGNRYIDLAVGIAVCNTGHNHPDVIAAEHAGVEADLMTMAKGLAGGFPLSGVVGKAEIMDSVEPGGLGGTFGGSPIGCAAAHAVLDIIEKEDLCGKAVAIGEQLRAWAEQLQGETNCIGDIRINGAMSAIELVENADANSPAAELTKTISAEAVRRGVIILTCGVRGNVIRFLPPLTIGEELLAEALKIIGDIIREKAGEGRKAS